jgi:hypothetical protein
MFENCGQNVAAVSVVVDHEHSYPAKVRGFYRAHRIEPATGSTSPRSQHRGKRAAQWQEPDVGGLSPDQNDSIYRNEIPRVIVGYPIRTVNDALSPM